MNKDLVSVVMPVYNEEKCIKACLDSLLEQDYPKEKMEWIIVDGGSTDRTLEILEFYRQKYPELIKILDNPKKIVPCAMNIGIRQASGKYIIRLDAHAEYEKDYFTKCVYHLDNGDADNVGGIIKTKAKTKRGESIAKMLSSKFGVGNSQFRTNGKSGYVDTVPFGAFRREVFSEYGGYDERLVRNQDNEMNYRIRKNGGKVYLSDDIKLSYYCRDTVKGISAMARTNGKWNIITKKLCPGSMSARHFIPLLFVLSLTVLAVAGIFYRPIWYVLAAELSVYLVSDLIAAVKSADSFGEFWFLLFLFPVFHLNYGIGSLAGIFLQFSKKYGKNGYTPEKI